MISYGILSLFQHEECIYRQSLLLQHIGVYKILFLNKCNAINCSYFPETKKPHFFIKRFMYKLLSLLNEYYILGNILLIL